MHMDDDDLERVVGDEAYMRRRVSHWVIVGTCCIMGCVGTGGGLLLGRLYSYGGGEQKWLYTAIQTVGWPILIPPLLLTYYLGAKSQHEGKSRDPTPTPTHINTNTNTNINTNTNTNINTNTNTNTNTMNTNPHTHTQTETNTNTKTILTSHDLWVAHSHMGASFTPTFLFTFVAMGFLTSMDNFLFVYGLSYLSISTTSLLTSSQLAFNAIFSFLVVRHRFTAASLNAVVAITLGTVLLGLHAVTFEENDLPPDTSRHQYALAILATLGGSALLGLIFPLMQLAYQTVVHKATFCVILEAQIVLAMSATAFSLVGMGIGHEFSAIPDESKNFRYTTSIYCLMLVASALCWQLSFLGTIGLVFVVSALFSSIVTNAFFPMLSLIAIGVYHDEFSALKAISVVLSFWGVISYAYGGYVEAKYSQLSTILPRDEESTVP